MEDRSSNAAVIGDKACPQLLEAMVDTMKGAVGMSISLPTRKSGCTGGISCKVSLYNPCNRSNMAARKERLRLSAIALSSEESRTKAIGDSIFEQYDALFEHEGKTVFEFFIRELLTSAPESSTSTLMSDLGQSISQNANLVRHLMVQVGHQDQIDVNQFLRDLFSVDGAFPSLHGAYLHLDYSFSKGADMADLPPHIMRHVRTLAIYGFISATGDFGDLAETPPYLKQLGSMIRNKDYGIEEVIFDNGMLKYGCAEVLDDTLRNVRSFDVIYVFQDAEALLLAASFERTKAEGDQLVRVRFVAGPRSRSMAPTLIVTIVRSRPNLQVLELGTVSHSTFNVLCNVVTTSILTKLKVGVVLRADTEYSMLAEGIGKLLQHPTIRDLELTIEISKDSHVEDTAVPDLMQSVAGGLRATRLRRFHCIIPSCKAISSTTTTKLYEGVRENRNLMDIQLNSSEDLSPSPFTFLDFVSSRNQYLCGVLMRDENTLPPGLWPLILESASDEASVLQYLLNHLVNYQGNVRRTPDADILEKSVDGPSRKRPRRN